MHFFVFYCNRNVHIHCTGIDDVQQFAYSELGGAGKWTEDALARHTAMIWALLDSQQVSVIYPSQLLY